MVLITRVALEIRLDKPNSVSVNELLDSVKRKIKEYGMESCLHFSDPFGPYGSEGIIIPFYSEIGKKSKDKVFYLIDASTDYLRVTFVGYNSKINQYIEELSQCAKNTIEGSKICVLSEELKAGVEFEKTAKETFDNDVRMLREELDSISHRELYKRYRNILKRLFFF